MIVLVLIFAAFPFTAVVKATPPITFEQTLGQGHQQILATRTNQIKAQDEAMRGRVDKVTRQINALLVEAYFLPDDFILLRRLAEDCQPKCSTLNPSLRRDIAIFTEHLHALTHNLESARLRVRWLSHIVTKSHNVEWPVWSLALNAYGLNNSIEFLSPMILETLPIFRNSGFFAEAQNLYLKNSKGLNSSKKLRSEALELLDKTR
ncbi:MAG: hypothetical protein HY399_05880 [Elusimicrobia bacterium]|nr:hypothetical protein [Elusimicrobiota bacterium]